MAGDKILQTLPFVAGSQHPLKVIFVLGGIESAL